MDLDHVKHRLESFTNGKCFIHIDKENFGTQRLEQSADYDLLGLENGHEKQRPIQPNV